MSSIGLIEMLVERRKYMRSKGYTDEDGALILVREFDALMQMVATMSAREKVLVETLRDGMQLAEWLIEDEEDQRYRVSTESKAKQFKYRAKSVLEGTPSTEEPESAGREDEPVTQIEWKADVYGTYVGVCLVCRGTWRGCTLRDVVTISYAHTLTKCHLRPSSAPAKETP